MIEISNRKVAQLKGAKKYYTGIPCPKGHVVDRRTDNGACTTCQAEYKHTKYVAGWRQPPNKETSARKSLKWRTDNSEQYWIRRAVSRARIRALKYGVPFNITVEDIAKVMTSRCPIFGTKFKYIGNTKSVASSPSLDRVVPALGYVVGNIGIISMKANVIKQNASSADLYKVADWVKLQGY